ncbi:MAG: hypothetical protein ACI85O_000669 [Saprospiraceae bacterium]|jgi:hypothetical protein
MKQKLLFLLSILLLAGTSCSKDEPDTQFNVNTDFVIDMKESLSPTGVTLLFKAKTTSQQDCLDTGIDFRFSRNASKVILSFLDLIAPEDCMTGSAPAAADINAGDLATIDYQFEIDLRGEVKSNGILNILGDRYIVSFVKSSGFEFPEKILLRIPRFTVWGYVNHNESDEGIAADFISSLGENASPATLEEGYYGWFKGADDKVTEMDNLPTERFNSLFVFEYDGTEEALESLIADFRLENENMELALFNWEGKSF